MPRHGRQKSKTGIYHIMLRGINRQVIFEDEEDYKKFLDVLAECKAISEFKIFAYCLMSNHVHLLIKVGTEDLSTIFKRIGGRYVYWYNNKYRRSGHLFQDRFKSEIVESEDYLLTVIRYIHQNPVKAGLISDAKEYQQSSYREYICPEAEFLADTNAIYKLIDRAEFVKYHERLNNDKCLEVGDPSFRLTDKQAMESMIEISSCQNSSEFQDLDAPTRDKYLRLLKEAGVSIRQLSRLTGISVALVRKA
jgi:REP element-mobilizing transposase RayT